MGEVWVFGSVAWDKALYVDRHPASGDRVTATCNGRRAGGSSGNIARALASAGHRVTVVSRVGQDDSGTRLIAELASWSINTAGIQRQASLTKERLLLIGPDGERTIIAIDEESTGPVDVPYEAMTRVDCAYVARYGDFDAALASSLRRTCPLVVTGLPAKDGDWFAHVLIGSARQLAAASSADPFAWARQRVGEQVQSVVITEGEAGALVYLRSGAVHIPAIPTVPVDSTGAGDSFAAGLIHGLLAGDDVAAAGQLASRWGAIATTLPQSVPPTWSALTAEISRIHTQAS